MYCPRWGSVKDERQGIKSEFSILCAFKVEFNVFCGVMGKLFTVGGKEEVVEGEGIRVLR